MATPKPMLQPYKVESVPSKQFQKNTKIPFSLPLNGKIGKGYVIVEGSITINNDGTTNGTAKGEGGPIGLIKRVTIRCNAAANSRYFSGEVVNCTPRALLRNAITQRTKFLGELGGSTLAAGAAGTYSIYMAIPVYFADPNHLRQWTTALNADEKAYQSIQLFVETGDVANCFTGHDRTVNYDNLSVRWVDERHDFPGDTWCLFQEDHDATIPAAKEDFVDEAMKQDGGFLSWQILTQVGASQALQDTILNGLKVQGNGVWFDLKANDIRQRMFDDGWYDAAQTATGQYFVDFTDGLLNRVVPAAGLVTKFDVAMVSASNVDALRIYTRRIFVPANFDAGQMAEYK